MAESTVFGGNRDGSAESVCGVTSLVPLSPEKSNPDTWNSLTAYRNKSCVRASRFPVRYVAAGTRPRPLLGLLLRLTSKIAPESPAMLVDALYGEVMDLTVCFGVDWPPLYWLLLDDCWAGIPCQIGSPTRCILIPKCEKWQLALRDTNKEILRHTYLCAVLYGPWIPCLAGASAIGPGPVSKDPELRILMPSV